MRMPVKNCELFLEDEQVRTFYDSKTGIYPRVDEAEEINHLLWTIFDNRVSHLLSSSEITKAIKDKDVTIHRNASGDIDAVLQVKVQPKKFYINQIYNSTDRKVIHAMLQNRLRPYVEQGGKYIYAWVDKDNIASRKFHMKYGLTHDGMWNMVFFKGK